MQSYYLTDPLMPFHVPINGAAIVLALQRVVAGLVHAPRLDRVGHRLRQGGDRVDVQRGVVLLAEHPVGRWHVQHSTGLL